MSYNDITVFLDGTYPKYQDVNLGLMNHAFLYGTSCFEAMRAYRSQDGRDLRVLAARQHFERLANSARILRMTLRYTVDELVEAVAQLIRLNGYDGDLYIRATLFKSAEQLGVKLDGVADSLAIVAVPFASYYGKTEALSAGISSWKRIEDNVAPARAKIGGIYINSALAKSDAIACGFDEAITLTEDGHVAEASAANIFLRRGNELITPSVTENILEGITRRLVLEHYRGHGDLTVSERPVDRSELYIADEIFITGTAVGIAPIGSVDHRPIGSGGVGPYTRELQYLFGDGLREHTPALAAYLDNVPIKKPVADDMPWVVAR